MNQNIDWDKLKVFLAVAEAGSFTHAGETLHLSQSAVSRQISGLEQSLPATLFHRHARGLILTEQGEILFNTVKEVFSKLSMATAILSENKERPGGPLTITATMALGLNWLTPHLQEFNTLYPEVQLTLLLEDHELDLSMRDADIAIRLSPPRQPDLIQRHLMMLHFHLYATKSYIEQNGMVENEEELNEHQMVMYDKDWFTPISGVNWPQKFIKGKLRNHKKIFFINSIVGMHQAIKANMGIGSLPDYLAAGEPDLVRVLPEISGPSVNAYFVYPEELRHSKRISVFKDFLIRKVSEGVSW